MNRIGMYAGVQWKRQRVCDVMVLPSRSLRYFIYNEHGEPTGDHFGSLSELQEHIESMESDAPVRVLGGTVRENPEKQTQ